MCFFIFVSVCDGVTATSGLEPIVMAQTPMANTMTHVHVVANAINVIHRGC